MDSIIDQIRTLAGTADEPGRTSIYNDLRSLLPELQSPMDMIMDLFNSVLCVLHVSYRPFADTFPSTSEFLSSCLE